MSKTKEVGSKMKPSEFFKKLDLSKLDTNTAEYVRTEILSFDNADLLDGTPEFEEVRKMIEENYPQALGIVPVPKEDIKITEPEHTTVKKTVTGKVNKKELEKLKKEEQKSAKLKHKEEIEEIESLIELMQETVKENKKDTDSKDYLELLEETLKELKKKKFEEGGEVDDNDDDSKLEHIGSLVKKGYTSGYHPDWTLSIEFDGKIDDSDREHIGNLVADGYTSGQIVSGEEEKTGWWSIEIGEDDEMAKGGKIPFKHRFIMKPKEQPYLIISGEIVEHIGGGKKTTKVTINGYLYNTINPLSKKKYRVLLYREYYGVLYYEKFKTYDEANKYLMDKSKHLLKEIESAERLEESEIEYAKGGGLDNSKKVTEIKDLPNGWVLEDSQDWDGFNAFNYRNGKYKVRVGYHGGHLEDYFIIANYIFEQNYSTEFLVSNFVTWLSQGVPSRRIKLSSSTPVEKVNEAVLKIMKDVNDGKFTKRVEEREEKYFQRKENRKIIDKYSLEKYNRTSDDLTDDEYKSLVKEVQKIEKLKFEDGGSINPKLEGKYIYKLNESNGTISASVKDLSTGNEVWDFKYPDMSLSEEEREFQSTPVSDGFIRHWEDIRGLETYLKDLGVIPNEGKLFSESEAESITASFENGGSINIKQGSNIMFNHDGARHRGHVSEITQSGKYVVGYLDKVGQVLVEKNQIIDTFQDGGNLTESKFKKGDVVNYTETLSGFDNNTPLEIEYINYKDGSDFGTKQGYYYMFKDSNLSSHEDYIKGYENGGSITEPFVIGDILKNKKRDNLYSTVIQTDGKNKFLVFYSDKDGKGVVGKSYMVQYIWEWEVDEWEKTGHVELEKVEKKYKLKKYSFYKSGNKEIDTYLSLMDKRYVFFLKNASKSLKEKFEELESNNHHFSSAELVDNFFENPKLKTHKASTKVKMAKGGALTNGERVENVLRSYVTAALWSSSDDEQEPLDTNYSFDNVDEKTLNGMRQDIINFMINNSDVIKASGMTDDQLGHDLWLTRNGHGTGFWDRGYEKEIADKLTAAAKEMKGTDLFVDNGTVYGEGYAKGGQTKAGVKQDKKIKALHAGKRESADGNVYYENRKNRSDKNRTKKFKKGGQTKSGIKQDKTIKALHAGKRESADGNIYYENRANRSDKNRTKKLKKGGKVSEKFGVYVFGSLREEFSSELTANESARLTRVIHPKWKVEVKPVK